MIGRGADLRRHHSGVVIVGLRLALLTGVLIALAHAAALPQPRLAETQAETQRMPPGNFSAVPTANCSSPIKVCYQGPRGAVLRVLESDPANFCRDEHAVALEQGNCVEYNYTTTLGKDPVRRWPRGGPRPRPRNSGLFGGSLQRVTPPPPRAHALSPLSCTPACLLADGRCTRTQRFGCGRGEQ